MIHGVFTGLAAAVRQAVCILAGMMLLCAPAAAPAETAEAAETLRVIFLDVGKGDCVLIAGADSCVLIDTGYANTAPEVAASLRRAGADHLDVMIITHYDKDHAGGAKALIESFPVGRVYLPGYEGDGSYYSVIEYALRRAGVPAEKVTEDISFTLSGVRYEIFATALSYIPGEGKKEGNDNDVSLVVAMHRDADSFLFAGDIEKDGIAGYLAAGHGTYDVVKMPHHGQKESNSDDFIGQVRPRIAVITDSWDDPANKKVLRLLEAAGAEIYRTSECGDITVSCTGNGTYDVVTESE